MIEFKTVQFLANAKSGAATTLTKTVDFAAHVDGVQTAIQGFELRYEGADHHVLREFVRVTQAKVKPGDDTRVEVTVSFGLRDGSGAAFDDAYGGSVDVLLIAETTPLIAPRRPPEPIPEDTWVALRTHDGHYLTVDLGGVLSARGTSAAASSPRFRLSMLDAAEGSALVDHHLVSLAWRDPVSGLVRCGSAEGGGGSRVVFDRADVREWETFELRRSQQPPADDRRYLAFGDTVSLRSRDGHFLCAEGGGGREVLVNRFHVKSWETFTIEPGWDPIQ